MLVVATPAEAMAILGAMRAVAGADGANTLSDPDRHALVAAGTYGLGLSDPVDPDTIATVTAAELASGLPDPRDPSEAASADGTEGVDYHPIA